MVGLHPLPVREAGQEGGICPCCICPFGGGANITKTSLDDVLFPLSFPRLEAGSLFAIFFSVNFLCSVSAHKLSPFLYLFHFISLGLLASEQRRDIMRFPLSSSPCSGWWMVPQPGPASGAPPWEGSGFIPGQTAMTNVVTSAGGMLLIPLRDVPLTFKTLSDGNSTSSSSSQYQCFLIHPARWPFQVLL